MRDHVERQMTLIDGWRGLGYKTMLQELRFGERLRPCHGCMACAGYLFMKLPAKLHDRVKLDGVTELCGGSGVLVTRIRCPGDKHFLIAERRWVPATDCRLCAGRGVVKFPLDRSGQKCPGCCNCAVGACKNIDPDGLCAEDYMHCVDGVISP